MQRQSIELIARAIIIADERILLCRNQSDDFYYFPGGHVEVGESAEAALGREMHEELGVAIEPPVYLGSVEHQYHGADGPRHELNLIFQTSFAGPGNQSLEDGIEFEWLDRSQITQAKVLPDVLFRMAVDFLKPLP